MPIQMVVRMCSIDERPIESSEAYRQVRALLGRRAADRLTYEIAIPAVP